MSDKSLSNNDLEILREVGYSERAIEYVVNHVNLGILKDPDVRHIQIGECGDLMYLYINLEKDGRIEDVKYRYAGCAALAASGSCMTEIARGKTIHEAVRLTEEDIMRDLESLPEGHMHCPKLAVETLRGALDPILNNRLLTKEEHDDYMHLCGLTGRQLEELPSNLCNNCDDVDECEKDHLLIHEERSNLSSCNRDGSIL